MGSLPQTFIPCFPCRPVLLDVGPGFIETLGSCRILGVTLGSVGVGGGRRLVLPLLATFTVRRRGRRFGVLLLRVSGKVPRLPLKWIHAWVVRSRAGLLRGLQHGLPVAALSYIDLYTFLR